MTVFSAALLEILSGQKITGTKLDNWHSVLAAITGPWNDYSGSLGWSSSGTPPTIGNGQIVATYIQVGKFVACKGRITMGSTTTFGTGTWQVNLPVTGTGQVIGAGLVFDASTTANKQPAVIFGSSATIANFAGIGGPVTPTVPVTWAVGDHLDWGLTYDAA